MAYYCGAVAERERECMPLIGPCVDRRCLAMPNRIFHSGTVKNTTLAASLASLASSRAAIFIVSVGARPTMKTWTLHIAMCRHQQRERKLRVFHLCSEISSRMCLMAPHTFSPDKLEIASLSFETLIPALACLLHRSRLRKPTRLLYGGSVVRIGNIIK